MTDEFSVHDDSHTIDEFYIVEKCDDDLLNLEVNPNDFVLIKFVTKKSEIFFIGQIESKVNDELFVKFLRKKDNSWRFYFPEMPDLSTVDIGDVVLKLPQPDISGGTLRTVTTMVFPIDLSMFKMG